MAGNIPWGNCSTCCLVCELKVKGGIVTFSDLEKAPENCPYKIYFSRSSNIIAEQYGKIASGIIEQYSGIAKHFAEQQKAIADLRENLPVPQITFSQIAPVAKQLIDAYQGSISSIAQTYYPLKELEIISKPTTPPPPKSLSAKLIGGLSSCMKGRKHWQKFQLICKDILTYLFVPPLGEPIEESRTKTGLERRDLIFQIPYDADGFWQMIFNIYGARALIVDCKNYSEPVGKDEVLDISQYLAKKRLGNFGIILSRCPPSESAMKEIKKLWSDDDKMIICLDDEELKKMIQFKENNERSEKIIDKKILDFLASLE